MTEVPFGLRFVVWLTVNFGRLVLAEFVLAVIVELDVLAFVVAVLATTVVVVAAELAGAIVVVAIVVVAIVVGSIVDGVRVVVTPDSPAVVTVVTALKTALVVTDVSLVEVSLAQLETTDTRNKKDNTLRAIFTVQILPIGLSLVD
ncbi:MAG: hypothetical protein EB108_02360 [Actinobacteria bacterium]|nr:hypothetical protein [Actinomycetota bacterium]